MSVGIRSKVTSELNGTQLEDKLLTNLVAKYIRKYMIKHMIEIQLRQTAYVFVSVDICVVYTLCVCCKVYIQCTLSSVHTCMCILQCIEERGKRKEGKKGRRVE